MFFFSSCCYRTIRMILHSEDLCRTYALELFSLLCNGSCFLSVDVRLCVVQIACADRKHPLLWHHVAAIPTE